jgi:hypothetical protein
VIARAAVLLLLAAGMAEAKPGTPGPPYFNGIYERIGRSGGGLVDDLVQITPAGQGVVIRACTGAAVRMGFGPAFEVNNLMTGAVAGIEVDCLFHNNGYNRPILTCRVHDGGAFTLWPTTREILDCQK